MADKSKVVHGLKNFRSPTFSIEGMDELVQNLDLTQREGINLARSAVHGVAGQLRDDMRSKAPKDTGTLRKAITAVRKRGTPTMVESHVMITKGANQKNDAWYWHMVEWGTQKNPKAQPFVTPANEEMRGKIDGIYREQFSKKLLALIARKAKKAKLK